MRCGLGRGESAEVSVGSARLQLGLSARGEFELSKLQSRKLHVRSGSRRAWSYRAQECLNNARQQASAARASTSRRQRWQSQAWHGADGCCPASLSRSFGRPALGPAARTTLVNPELHPPSGPARLI